MKSRKKFIYAQAERYNEHAKELLILSPGDHVRIQHHANGSWDRKGLIQSVRDRGRSYVVVSDGREILRNRRHLKLIKDRSSEKPCDIPEKIPLHQRPSRLRKPPTFYQA